MKSSPPSPRTPYPCPALAQFGVLALAVSYGPAAPGDATRYLLKYADLLCIPAIAAFFADSRPRWRRTSPVVVIAMAVGCLFNSFLLDHTEGTLYAWFMGLIYGGLKPRDAQT